MFEGSRSTREKKSSANQRKEHNVEKYSIHSVGNYSAVAHDNAGMFIRLAVVASPISEIHEIPTEFELIGQGHPRSSILVPIESACNATAY